jgi:two-component system, OmpR family, response regulator
MKILLVEDDVKLAAIVARGLEGEGFTVVVAHDGDEGYWRATENHVDAIVLDVLLPKRNGFALCRDLRARGQWTPILMLTAKAGDLDEAEGLDLGADDYLTKPFSFPVLVARLRSLVRRATALGEPAPAAVGDLRIDSRARRAFRGETELALTSRQFDVLEVLVRHAGEVLSKADLLRQAWPDDFDGDPNIVEVYVRRLRACVDEPFGRSSIETVRGAGYRLVPS